MLETLLQIPTLIVLWIFFSAAAERITSIIVEGKIFAPIRGFVSRRAFPAKIPALSPFPVVYYGGLNCLAISGFIRDMVGYLFWNVWIFINSLITCHVCTGVWISGIAAYFMPSQVPGMQDGIPQFLVKAFAISYAVACLEVFRVGRVKAVDLELKLSDSAIAVLGALNVGSNGSYQTQGLDETDGRDLQSSSDQESPGHQTGDQEPGPESA